MKTNEIRVTINAPQKEVFEYTLEPKNTPRWISGMNEEVIDTEQIGMGTIYSNDFGNFEVTDYERDKYFELTNHETTYQCSYTYHKVDPNTTEIVYFEAMGNGSDLEEPMMAKHFETLKKLLESN